MHDSRSGSAFAGVDRIEADLRATMIAYLDGVAAHPVIQRVRYVEQEALRLRPGQRVLDAGCGLGEVAQALAVPVGPSGRVDAVDVSQTLLSEAARRLRESPLPPSAAAVHYMVGALPELDFADALFDVVRCERVLQHLADPDAAVAELARLTRPGGRVSLVDTDWESLTIDGVPADLADRVQARIWQGPMVAHAAMGRTLRRRLLQAGIGNVECQPVTACFTELDDAQPVVNVLDGETLKRVFSAGPQSGPADADLAAEWGAAVRAAAAADQLLVTLTMWVVTGTR